MVNNETRKTLTEDSKTKLYIREYYTLAESLYNNYNEMRIALNNFEKMKYEVKDKYISNEDFKQGFIAGVKIMSSMFLDM